MLIDRAEVIEVGSLSLLTYSEIPTFFRLGPRDSLELLLERSLTIPFEIFFTGIDFLEARLFWDL